MGDLAKGNLANLTIGACVKWRDGFLKKSAFWL
jgi:hypothetical protein